MLFGHVRGFLEFEKYSLDRKGGIRESMEKLMRERAKNSEVTFSLKRNYFTHEK